MNAVENFVQHAPWYVEVGAICLVVAVIVLIETLITLFRRDRYISAFALSLRRKQEAFAREHVKFAKQLGELDDALDSVRSCQGAQARFDQEVIELLQILVRSDREDLDAQLRAFLADTAPPFRAPS